MTGTRKGDRREIIYLVLYSFPITPTNCCIKCQVNYLSPMDSTKVSFIIPYTGLVAANLSRRRRLFEHLGESGRRAAFTQGAAARRSDLEVLMEATASQLNELQGFLGRI